MPEERERATPPRSRSIFKRRRRPSSITSGASHSEPEEVVMTPAPDLGPEAGTASVASGSEPPVMVETGATVEIEPEDAEVGGAQEGLSDELEADEDSVEDFQRMSPEFESVVHSSQGVVRALPRVIAIANQKGGVGKTTTAVNLGASLADLGFRTLVIDLDPQGNASTGLGINTRALEVSMYDVVLNDMSLEDCIEASAVKNLFVAPASLDLAGAEIELVPAFSRELRVRRAIEEVRDDYDYLLIDCPPSLGLLTVNALAAASEVMVPIQCEYYALEGLGQLLRNVDLVQRNLNPSLELSAIVLVMYDGRTKLAEHVAREVRAHFGDTVCSNVIPRTVRLSEAPSFGQPITTFDSSSRGAVAYRELAREVSGGAA